MMNQINICEELSHNFIDFSYEANSRRGFADARDGLKPGQRACLWEMYKSGYTSNKPHVKSAKISGGVISNWWPHGDAAIYETFARMSQDWINNIPEVDWHGGNGSQIISAEPSAARYTEARLSKATEEGMLFGLKKHNVPMILNFSEDMEWPEVFPAILPRLLINGCQGIGVTIANVWLPHSLIDVGKIVNEYITTGKINYNEIAPSFPSGGIIVNKEDLHNIYETGKGKVILRAKVEFKGNSILITELPYQVYIEPLIDNIKELIKVGKLEGIEEINNKSDKHKLLVEIVCDNPSTVLNKLFKLTDLQKTYNANQWALVGKTPTLLNLKEYLDIYIEHNLKCIIREHEFDYNKAKDRLEIVEGLLRAIEDIDNIITLIKTSKSSNDAKGRLIEKYNFSEKQAKAIIDMKLGKLAGLEKIELNRERETLVQSIEQLILVINDREKQKEIFTSRFNELVKKFGVARKTEITQINTKKEKEQVVLEPKDCVVIVTDNGLIKRIDKKNFKAKKRNTAGIKTKDSIVKFSQSTNTQDVLMVFSSLGKMYRILVDNIPEGTNTSIGVPLSTLIKFENNEVPMAYTTLTRDTTKKFIFFATKKGVIKKVPLSEYDNIKRTGILAIKFKEGDSLAAVTFIDQEQMILVTKNGMTIKFETTDMPISSRIAQGVKGMNVAEDDEIIAALPIFDKKDYLAIVSEKGLGKKIELSEFPIQNRGGRGLFCYKEKIAGAIMVKEEDNLLVNGNKASIVVSCKDVPTLTRTSMGNIMMKNSDNIIAIAKI